MLPTFTADPRVRLVAGADPLPAAREQFTRDFGGPAFDDVERLCAREEVDVVYVATPHQFHARHTTLAFAHGKHVLLEKPMAITLDDCTAISDRRAYRAVVAREPPVHDGAWARATLEACLAILASARERREITLDLQVSTKRG